MEQKVAVLGAGGFIGDHLVSSLKERGYHVVGVDLKLPNYSVSRANKFVIGDLRDQKLVSSFFKENQFEEVYQLAADMGGAGYVFTGEHDADIMHNSVQINLNVLEALRSTSTKVFYSSSACIYPEENQLNPSNPNCEESSAFPANPDSEYGWEKLFSERLYLSYARNYNMNIRIARFHNIYGPNGHFDGGREKAPAALSRKVAMAKNGDSIDIWGSGTQTRSFLYIDECIEGVSRLMDSSVQTPINIGSDEMISINNLAQMIIDISGKDITINNIDGPVGVQGRCSDNRFILNSLKWQPNYPLQKGMRILFNWVQSQI
ncbi:MAG: NAD-dependent epimerase/dehydratase family protein [Bacteroidia bacterium]